MNSTSANHAYRKVDMQKLTGVLFSLLLFQIILAAGLMLSSSKVNTSTLSAPLFAIDISKVNKISIGKRSNGDKKKIDNVVLECDAKGAWSIPQISNFPVPTSKVDSFLRTIKSLTKGVVVTTSNDSLDHFLLSKDNYKVSITLSSPGQKDITAYLGSADSYRNLHVRYPESNEVYCVELPELFNTNPNPDEWIDNDMADVQVASTKGIEINGGKLFEKDGKWTLSSGGKEQAVNSANAVTYLNNFPKITISSVLGTKPNPEYNADKPEYKFSLTTKDGKQIDYSFSRGKNGTILKMSNHDYYMNVGNGVIESLKRVNNSTLLQKVESSKGSEGQQSTEKQTSRKPTTDQDEPVIQVTETTRELPNK